MVLLSLSADKTGIYNFGTLSYYTYGKWGRAFSNLRYGNRLKNNYLF